MFLFQDDKCRYNPKKSGATDTGMVDIKPDEDHLKEAVATIGPVSVAIDASHESFQFYKEGKISILYHINLNDSSAVHIFLVL